MSRPRRRLKMGFDDDFGVLELKIVRVEPIEPKHADEKLEWISEDEQSERDYFAESSVWQFRVKSGVVLSAIALVVATITFLD